MKNVKSKIECWGQEGTGTTKKNKKSENMTTFIDEEAKANDFLSELYNIYNNIETHFSSKISSK